MVVVFVLASHTVVVPGAVVISYCTCAVRRADDGVRAVAERPALDHLVEGLADLVGRPAAG